MTWIITAIIFFLIWLFYLGVKATPEQKKSTPPTIGKTKIHRTAAPKPKAPEIRISDIKVVCKSGDEDGCFFCTLAGVKYRCTANDIGGFLGYIKPDPTNEHDPNAVAVYRNDNKHLGFIPRDDLEAFAEWSEGKEVPCIGFIKQGDEVLFGKVKALDPSNEECMEFAIIKFVRWLVCTFGTKYIPKGFAVNGDAPSSRREWLDFLDAEISRRDSSLFEYV